MIHPTAIIEDGVQLGAGCVVHASAIIKRHTVLGDGVVVHPYAVIGGDPQDLNFKPETVSGVRVGARTVIREFATLNRATKPGQFTEIGEDCFLMAGAHAGHDCRVGNRVIIANSVLLAGHVQVGDRAFLGGGSEYHQHIRVGESVMVGGGARIAMDLPPFVMAAERNEVFGLNLVGLKRRGLPRPTIVEIKDAFRAVYFTDGNIRKIAQSLLDAGQFQSAEAQSFLRFFIEGKRGVARPHRVAVAEENED